MNYNDHLGDKIREHFNRERFSGFNAENVTADDLIIGFSLMYTDPMTGDLIRDIDHQTASSFVAKLLDIMQLPDRESLEVYASLLGKSQEHSDLFTSKALFTLINATQTGDNSQLGSIELGS
jgi:hypothetical protein